MTLKIQTYTDLAQSVASVLRKRRGGAPPLPVLTELFEAMYYSSLKTEEGLPISFHVVYVNPDDPDPEPPKRIRNDRWTFMRFTKPIRVTISNLIKIAKASDPRTSSLAVHHDGRGRLFVWGLVDQGNSYHDYVNYESESGFARPGIFQASIMGVGHLSAFVEMQKIAELKVNRLVTHALDILSGGPIHDVLFAGIEVYLNSIKEALSVELQEELDEWDEYLKSVWIQSLCRLLLRVQKYRHGGAVLITPEESSKGLNIKYGLEYERLRLALERRALLHIEHAHVSNRIWADYVRTQSDDLPIGLYLDESVSRDEMEDNDRELDGTIWFISLLTRVDGLVLLTPRLDVRGFGVEITYSEEPSNVQLSGNRNATKDRAKKLDYNHYGTRHRSMMRYCSQVDGSVGFVVSQDGDVRAMTKVRGSLVVWENIKLQLPDFVRRRLSPRNVKTLS